MYDPFAVAVHEAGHAAVALLKGIEVVEVGLTPGVPGQNGICVTGPPAVGTLAGLIDHGVMVAAGGAAERLAGFWASGDLGDAQNLAAVRSQAGWIAPAGWAFPDVFAAAHAELSCPVTWAGVVSLARRIMACGGTVGGATAAAAVRAGWRDRALVGRIQAFGPQAVR